MKDRLHPLDKQRFLEGTRQKWVLFAVLLGLITMFMSIFIDGFDPSPYLQYFGMLIGAGIIGWSVDSSIKAYKVESKTQNYNTHEEEYGEQKKDVVIRYEYSNQKDEDYRL